MKPTAIIRHQRIIEQTEKQTRLCVTFEACFSDGQSKYLNLFQWVDNNLLRDFELTSNKAVLSPVECPLYHRDWTANPVYGDFNRDYPRQLLPMSEYLPGI